MQMILRAATITVAFSTVGLSLNCHAFTGNDLHNWGEGSNGGGGAVDWKSGSYLGYISAISDSFNEIAFCLPKGSTYQQIGAVVMKSLKANPETWEKSAALLVMDSLQKAYPCAKKK